MGVCPADEFGLPDVGDEFGNKEKKNDTNNAPEGTFGSDGVDRLFEFGVVLHSILKFLQFLFHLAVRKKHALFNLLHGLFTYKPSDNRQSETDSRSGSL